MNGIRFKFNKVKIVRLNTVKTGNLGKNKKIEPEAYDNHFHYFDFTLN